jgi:hypothetical protein
MEIGHKVLSKVLCVGHDVVADGIVTFVIAVRGG